MPIPEFPESGTERLTYVPPTIETISESELIETIGPAQAYTGQIPLGLGGGHGRGHGRRKK